ncbi:MAG TPA: NUDIX domain-containing protein, partial [Candidatus Paceibacterota bacterium]|nr:NUDIX domain-containing protein [Candidatus Paceibacterota bacterium]
VPESAERKHALWNEGVNYASDAVVTRKTDKGDLEILLILRKDGSWALPGGFRDTVDGEQEAAEVTMLREALEETKLDFSSFPVTKVYEGIVDDKRNEGTPGEPGSRWIETAAFHIDATGHSELVPVGGDDAQSAKWQIVTPELLDNLYASHGKIVRDTLTQIGEALDDF